jgi:hypothetical protein
MISVICYTGARQSYIYLFTTFHFSIRRNSFGWGMIQLETSTQILLGVSQIFIICSYRHHNQIFSILLQFGTAKHHCYPFQHKQHQNCHLVFQYPLLPKRIHSLFQFIPKSRVQILHSD